MKQIIEKLKSIMMDFEKIGFTDNQHTPYFLTLSEARQIVEALEGMENRRAFTLPKDEEVNGMLNIALRYLSDEQANALIEGLVERFVRPDDIKTKMLKDLSAKELEDDVNRNKI